MEVNFAPSGAGVVQQLTGGSLDVALSVGITDPLQAIDKGAPLAVVRIIGKIGALCADREARHQDRSPISRARPSRPARPPTSPRSISSG